MTARLPADRRMLIGLASAAVILAGLLVYTTGAALIVAALAALAVLVLFPEITLGLFLLSGVIKTPLASLAAAAGVELDITVLIGLALLVGLVFRGMKAGFSSLIPPADCLVPLGCLSLIILLSTLFGPETPYGREKAFRFLTLTNLAVLAPFICLNSHSRLQRFLVINIVLGFFVLLFGRVTSEGLSAFGSTHIAAGRTLGLGVLASAYLCFRQSSLLRRLLWLAVGTALLAGFLLSGSRGSFVALVAAVAATGVMALAVRRGRRLVLAVSAVAGLATLGVTLFAPAAVEVMNRRLTATVADPLTLTARTRLDRATAAFDAFAASPLFGAGIGGFDMLFSNVDTGRGDYPHNVFLEVAAELGLVGLAAFLLLLLRSLRRPFRALSYANRAAAASLALPRLILALACYALVNALFSGDLNDNRLLFAAIGMCFVPLEDQT
uniref:O-antigen ligase domain-containing protein n=1 Tax=candidate division WOR-3 bacterium TaxID=2052148 RepID=A0A7C4CDF6_UNCW3